MSGYGDVKSKRVKIFLRWLGNNSDIEIESGGKHPYKVKCIHTGSVYPLPLGHKDINKHTLKGFVDWLVRNDICSEQEFMDKL